MTDQTVNVPPELIPRLKQLWNAGLSAIQCGEELGLAGDPAAIRDAVIRAHQAPSEPKRRKSPTPTADTFWTEERVATLRKLHADGLSTEMIRREIGAASRSAVLGKLHRLGLASNPTVTANGPKTSRPPRSNLPARFLHERTIDPMFAVDVVDWKPAPADLEIAADQRRSLLGPPRQAYPERGAKECGWPVGDPKDPDFFYCGAPVHADRPYCLNHCRRAYDGVRRRAA